MVVQYVHALTYISCVATEYCLIPSPGGGGLGMRPVHASMSELCDIIPLTGDLPTLMELIRFRGRERRINVPQQIGTNLMNFWVLLMEDENGARIQSIIHECRDNPEQIATKVLLEWIAGRGKLPVSWDTLIEVLRDIDLGTLADDIAAVK